MIEKQCPTSVGCVRLRSDRGGEYLSDQFTSYLMNKGIQRQLTVAGTPHQNGIAERKNRTLLETARNIFLSAHFPTHLWKEAIKTTNYVQNQCSTRSLNLSSPYEALTRTKPDVSHFRIIGCSTFIFTPMENRGGKLQPTNSRAVLLGYDEESKAYRLYDPLQRKIIVSPQVHFLENQLGDFGHSNTSFTDVFSHLFDVETQLDGGPAALPDLPNAELPVNPAEEFLNHPTLLSADNHGPLPVEAPWPLLPNLFRLHHSTSPGILLTFDALLSEIKTTIELMIFPWLLNLWSLYVTKSRSTKLFLTLAGKLPCKKSTTH